MMFFVSIFEAIEIAKGLIQFSSNFYTSSMLTATF